MSKPMVAFPYYGGKNSHLRFLLPLLPPVVGHYVEPFGGSAALLLNRSPAPLETFNDLNHWVYNFWLVLRDHSDELLDRLRLAGH